MPPFGHATTLRIFIDPDLLQYVEVWAAAGTWNDNFGIEPHKLVEASGGGSHRLATLTTTRTLDPIDGPCENVSGSHLSCEL